jgi:hypothetical protein
MDRTIVTEYKEMIRVIRFVLNTRNNCLNLKPGICWSTMTVIGLEKSKNASYDVVMLEAVKEIRLMF